MAMWRTVLLLFLALILVAETHASSGDLTSVADWLDTSYSSEYRAASVVTSLWLGGFAITSAVFTMLGMLVALQWPNPRIFCYKTSYSDMPSSSGRSCCSLYSINLGFCVFWLLVFAIMAIARDVLRIVVCLCFCLAHTSVVVLFRMKFKRHGRPERPSNTDMITSSAVGGGGMLGPQPQAVGIPIYNIPMQTVVVGAPADSTTAVQGSTADGNSNSYWYDAACLPPQQQGMHAGRQQQSEAAVQHSGSVPAPYTQGMFNYPPQSTSTGPYPYAYPYPGLQQQQQQSMSPGQQQQQQNPLAVAGAADTTVIGVAVQQALVPASAAAAGVETGYTAGAVTAAGAGAATTSSSISQPGQTRQQL